MVSYKNLTLVSEMDRQICPEGHFACLNAATLDFNNIYVEKHCNHARHFEIERF